MKVFGVFFFCLCFESCFGSGAAVPCDSRASPRSCGTALPLGGSPFSAGGKTSSSPMARRSLLVPPLWGRFRLWKPEAVGHRGVSLARALSFLIFAVFPPALLPPLPGGVGRRSPRAPGRSAPPALTPREPWASAENHLWLLPPMSHGLWVRAGRCGAGISRSKPLAGR